MIKRLLTYMPTVILLMILIVSSTRIAKAQLSNLNLQAHGLAQNSLVNPALMPASSFVSMPFIGSFDVGVRTAFTSENMFTKIGGVNFINNTGMINALDGNNNISSMNLNLDLLSGGFYIGSNNYVGINLSARMHMASSVPGDVFSMLTDNPIELQTAVYDINLDPSVMGWSELGLSYSRKLPQGFTIGARIKFLSGFMSLNSESNFKVRKDYDQYILDGNFNIQGGNINLANMNVTESIAGLTDNLGLGADLGIAWEGVDGRLKISAAVTDMGVINWSEQSSTIKGSGTGFAFKGLGDLQNLLGSGGSLSSLMDSVSTAFTQTIGMDTVVGKFKTRLPARYQARFEYALGKKQQHGISVAFQGAQIIYKHFDYVLSAGYAYRSPNKRWQLMANYSYRPNEPYAFGVGTAYTSRGVQIYLGIDNIIPIFDISNANQTNFKFALNFMIPAKNKLLKEKLQKLRKARRAIK